MNKYLSKLNNMILMKSKLENQYKKINIIISQQLIIYYWNRN